MTKYVMFVHTANWQLYRKAWHFWGYTYSERDTSAICVVYSNLKDSSLAQKMELNREHFRVIIFYNFRHGLTQQQCIDDINSISNWNFFKDQWLSMIW